MLVKDSDKQRVRTIEELLREQDHVALKRFVLKEVPRGLLDDEPLNAARALNLVRTVVYLATLGVENLPTPNDRAVWLAVYQAIGAQRETADLRCLPRQLPIKWVTRSILADSTLERHALRHCETGKDTLESWLAAIELAVDQHRFDLVEVLVEHCAARKTSAEEWIHVASTLSGRQLFVEHLLAVAPLARSYARIHAALPGTPNLQDARSLLANHSARAFLQCGDYDRCIAMTKLCVSKNDRKVRLATLAEACCHKGDLARAIEWLDQLVALSITPAGLDEAKAEREQAQQRDTPELSFNTEAASQALVDLQKVLDESGQKAFLVSGTLLGYARDGQLLAHDKDIDVGILQWEDQYDVAIALLKSGRFWVRMRSIGDAQTYYIPIQHLPTRTTIDIFIYHDEGGRLVTGVQHFFGHMQKFAFTPFKLMQVDFLGARLHVPDEVDLNLSENFGNDWRVPDPGYLSHLESPSALDMGGLAYQVTGRLLVLKTLRAGKFVKLKRVLALLREHRGRSGGMSLPLLQAVDGICATLATEPDVEVVA